MVEWQSYEEFLAHPWPAPDNIVEQWLPTSGLAMIFGPRGGGKTFVTLELAICVAAGWPFLGDRVPKARTVLYVDGEMQAAKVAHRLRCLEKGQGPYPAWFNGNFRYLTHERFEFGIPDLAGDKHDPTAGKRGRRLIEEASKGCELVILDNMSSLLRGTVENEAEGWKDFLGWCMRFRRNHQTVLLIHHTGKAKGAGGEFTSRGSIAKEDPLDTVVKLETLSAEAGQPIHIEWKFTKWRHFQPEAPTHLEIAFSGEPEDCAQVRLTESPQKEAEEVIRLQAEGMTYREIQERTGVDKSRANRIVRQKRGVS